MSSLKTKRQKTIKRKGKMVLQTHKNSLKNQKEDIACPLFLTEGSLTIEAALVLPLFLLVSLTLISFINVMKYSVQKQMQIQEMLRCGAVYASALNMQVAGREGDYIFYDREYYVPLFTGIFGLKQVKVRQKNVVHIFNGYNDSYGDRIGTRVSYVYITKEGSVYHKKRSCQALSVVIREINGSIVHKERNLDRKIYRACIDCAKGYTQADIKKSTVYISEFGVKYHIKPNCSDLTRNVQVVKLEEVGTRPPCKFCG